MKKTCHNNKENINSVILLFYVKKHVITIKKTLILLLMFLVSMTKHVIQDNKKGNINSVITVYNACLEYGGIRGS